MSFGLVVARAHVGCQIFLWRAEPLALDPLRPGLCVEQTCPSVERLVRELDAVVVVLVVVVVRLLAFLDFFVPTS